MEEYLRQILEFLGVEFHETISGLEDSQPTIDIIQANWITYRVKHIAVPIGCIHEQSDIHKTRLAKILTYIKPSDMGTKPLSGPLHERHSSYIHGVRFYPPDEYGNFYQIDIYLHTMHWSSWPDNRWPHHLSMILSYYYFIIIFYSFLLMFHAINISKKGRKWIQCMFPVTVPVLSAPVPNSF